MVETRVYPEEQHILLSLQQNNNILDMKISEGWRGFDVLPVGYKLDNEGKPVVDQSFVHNLNSQIDQLSASSNSLVPMPPPPSGPPPILPYVTTYSRTAGKSFSLQCTRHKCSYHSLSSLYINGRPYNGPVYDDKVNCIT